MKVQLCQNGAYLEQFQFQDSGETVAIVLENKSLNWLSGINCMLIFCQTYLNIARVIAQLPALLMKC